jgi:hypothetical protein
MATSSFFANSAELQITAGATPVSVAAIRNIEITPKFEMVDLYGMESATRQSAAKHTHSVDFKCKYAIWDATNDYIMASFLAGQNLTSLSATIWDDAAHRNAVATFNVTAINYSTDRTRKVTATAYGVYFDSVTWALNENEFMARDLAGKGASFWMTATTGTF